MTNFFLFDMKMLLSMRNHFCHFQGSRIYVLFMISLQCLFQFILIFSWVDYERASHGSYTYPLWGDAIGWVMTMAVIGGIFLTMFIMFFKVEGTFVEVSHLYIKHGHCILILGKSVFFAHIGRAAVQYVGKKHRRAMYQKAVTMFYTCHTLKGCFNCIFNDISPIMINI